MCDGDVDTINIVYSLIMAKLAISLTLGEENLVWLKGLAVRKGDSVSAIIDDLISEVRTRRTGALAPPRSVVGTIDLPPGDPTLSGADEAIRKLFSRSLARPIVAREQPAQ